MHLDTVGDCVEMSLICGIDPGLDGAIAFVAPDWGTVDVLQRMPTIAHPRGRGRAYDLDAMQRLLSENNPARVFIEEYRPFAPPGRRIGIRSVRTGERGVALWEAFCTGFCPLTIVSPREWQKIMLRGMPTATKQQRKASAIVVAKREFPGTNLRPGKCGTDHDGMADSLLIAEYGRRQGYQGITTGQDPKRKPGHHRSPMAAK